MSAKIKIDVRIIGWLSVVAIAFELVGLAIVLSGSSGLSVNFMDIILLIGFSYIAYKILIKKKELSKWEWLVFAILLIIFILAFIIDFITG